LLYFWEEPMRNILVPQVGHTPLVAADEICQ